MTYPIATALRLLSRFWLEEVTSNDLEIIKALPELAQALPKVDTAVLNDLAVEYQRLFGFNLPPYESVFIDPSAMLMAPATDRVQALYRQGQWSPPADTRTGAPDHLGIELMAWADWLDAGQADLAYRLHTRHLALWGPAFALTLPRLAPHPFYATLGELTVDMILTPLPDQPIPADSDPFPILPLPNAGPGMPSKDQEEPEESLSPLSHAPDPLLSTRDETDVVGWRNIVTRLLLPRESGLFLTREDIARIGQVLNLSTGIAERFRMLESLFRLAGQYDLMPTLFDQLVQVLTEADAAYRTWADEYPLWRSYAQSWRNRLATTQATLEALKI